MRRGSSIPQSHNTKNHQKTLVKPPIPPKPSFDPGEQQQYGKISINQGNEFIKNGSNYYKEELGFNKQIGYQPQKDASFLSTAVINDARTGFRNDTKKSINSLTKSTNITVNNREVSAVSIESNISSLYAHPNTKNGIFLEKLNGVVSNYPRKDELFTRASSSPETDSLVTINQSVVGVNHHDSELKKSNFGNPLSLHSSMPKKHFIGSGGNVSINGVIAQKRPKSDISVTTGISTLNSTDQPKPQNGYMFDKENITLARETLKSREMSHPDVDIPDSIAYPVLINTIGMTSNTYINPQQSAEKTYNLQSTDSNINFESNNHMQNSSMFNKPTLRKVDAIEIDDSYDKKLSRGISRATDNLPLVSKARSELAQGIWNSLDSAMANGKSPYFVETPLFTFTLPDLTVYSDNFRIFLEKDLIETASLISLETAGRLNWWATIGASQRLWPLATTGDGNCLLHAASLGMWGFHDRLLTLRKALHEFLTKSQYSQPLWRRWRWQLAMQNRKTGLVYSPAEWEEEWQNVIKLASSKPRSENGCHGNEGDGTVGQTWSSLSQGKLDGDGVGHVYESLEEIHVLALSHVLRRPIIVVADITLKDVNGAPLAPIPFGGIYLPLECPPKECQKSPLLLTYDAAHFSALVVMETPEQLNLSHLPAVIPVTDNHHELLTIQFLIDPGEEFGWGKDEYDPIFIEKLMITSNDQRGLLSEYLNLIQVHIPSTYLDPTPYYNNEEIDVGDATHDLDKKSSESSFDSDDGRALSESGATKTKSKQIQTVVKQFGSIGRSMSKRIKKNLNTLSKLSRTGSFRSKNRPKGDHLGKVIRISTQQSYILAAEILIEKRQAYQEEMIKNYLNNAKKRFKEPCDLPRSEVRHDWSLGSSTVDGIQCVNSGCTLFATAETSYLCSICYERQKLEEEQEYNSTMRQPNSTANTRQFDRNSDSPRVSCSSPNFHDSPDSQAHRRGPQYGAGRSKFYADLDAAAIKTAAQIPISHSLSASKDRTLYLSNSVFYNDSNISIPSYNLNNSKNSKPKEEIRCRNTSNASSKSNVVYVSTNSGSANKQVVSIAPISIDGTFHNTVLHQSPQSCLSSDCEFFGNPSMDGYCSKCFVRKKPSATKSLYVERNEENI